MPEADAPVDVATLEKRLDRSQAKIQILEAMIEDKTRSLYLAQEELRSKNEFVTSVLESMQSAVVVTDLDSTISAVHGATSKMLGLPTPTLIGRSLNEFLRPTPGNPAVPGTPSAGVTQEAELVGSQAALPVLFTSSPLASEGEMDALVTVISDVSELRRLEVELRHAQKMESVGQLAAGIAHEINTPIQFLGDSVNFLAEAISDTLAMIREYRGFCKEADGAEFVEQTSKLAELEEELDIEFIEEEAPRSIERTKEGVRRVAEIVAAMKQFSHPGGGALAPVDLDEVVETTLVVAKNEYKYVAEVELDLGGPAAVMADRGDISQVILNLVVNAAHAISDHTPEGELGTIRIRTRTVDGGSEIAIADTGGGIPAEIRDRVFDPFFTTKDPGRGTGQGLAIAHTIVAERHGGRLEVEVEDGVGSTFRIFLPATVA